MAIVLFTTYAEAAAYAKRRAMERGFAVQVSRRGDEWAIYTRADPYPVEPAPPDGGLQPPLYGHQYRYPQQETNEQLQERQAIENWKAQKALHTPCYICGGSGGGDGGRTCSKCKGLGYIRS